MTGDRRPSDNVAAGAFPESEGSETSPSDGRSLRSQDRPAPVATDDGLYGEPWPEWEPEDHEGGGLRRVAAGLLTLLLAVAVAAWLVAFGVAEATSEEVAVPAQARGLATLTEVDALLALHTESLQAQVEAGDERLVPPGFPVREAGVPRETAVDASGAVDLEALRNALLEDSARRLYDFGSDALRDQEAAAEDGAVTDNARHGGVTLLLDGLTASRYESATGWLLPLGGVVLVLAAVVAVLARGFDRFVALGTALLLAGLGLAAGALLARLVLGFFGGGPEDALLDAYYGIASDLLGLPLRHGLWTTAAALAILVPALALRGLFGRSVRRG